MIDILNCRHRFTDRLICIVIQHPPQFPLVSKRPTGIIRHKADQCPGFILQPYDLDARIGKASQNWSVDRMARVDLAIMRMAVWELLHEDDVPGPVVINEAVELANRYSGEGSGRFINGILGTILRSRGADA
jgi:N utilization substance protein B